MNDIMTSGDFVKNSTLLYASLVNRERQLPLSFDGLKPVYRRAIYAALKFNGEHVKTAKIVGEMISNLHPAGDASCIPVISNLVHYGILSGRGNHGTKKLDGQIKPHAAPRYTEAWISEKYNAIFRPLLDYVPWRETDLFSTEPCYLPTPIPICLTFGLIGIGHGAFTRIPIFTATSLYEAYMADDPSLLKAPYGLEIDYECSDLEELWKTGKGRVTYQYKVYPGTSDDGSKGAYIEGIPEYFVPDVGAFEEYRASNKVFINDESDKTCSRLFIGKNKNIRVISQDEIYELAWGASRYSKVYQLNVSFGDYVCIIPLREWLDLTYKNYLTLTNNYKENNIAKLQKEEKVFTWARKVADTFLKDTEKSNSDIANELQIEEEIVSAVLRRSIGSLRKTDFEPKLNAVRKQIEEFSGLVPEKYTEDIIMKL